MNSAWQLVTAAARVSATLAAAGRPAAFAAEADGLHSIPIDRFETGLLWQPDNGWEARLPAGDPRAPLIDLYLPVCGATTRRPITVGHLGQSLDGFIATHAGESRWVTGPENMVHMHRMRALCDAVLVGAGTVAADDPQLTTRLVDGPSPVRVVLDPTRRLEPRYRVFAEGSSETLYVCGRSLVTPGERGFGGARVIGVAEAPGGVDLHEVVRLLHGRGCARVFIEGGGVTVSAFLAANLLDRLHVAVAPLLIGDGRPAIRLPARAALDDCHRPSYRVFRMGGDVLFDCDLRAGDAGPPPADADPTVTRVI